MAENIIMILIVVIVAVLIFFLGFLLGELRQSFECEKIFKDIQEDCRKEMQEQLDCIKYDMNQEKDRSDD